MIPFCIWVLLASDVYYHYYAKTQPREQQTTRLDKAKIHKYTPTKQNVPPPQTKNPQQQTNTKNLNKTTTTNKRNKQTEQNKNKAKIQQINNKKKNLTES